MRNSNPHWTTDFAIIVQSAYSKRLYAGAVRSRAKCRSLPQLSATLPPVLTNVKIMVAWSDDQLGAFLEDILTPDQYRAGLYS